MIQPIRSVIMKAKETRIHTSIYLSTGRMEKKSGCNMNWMEPEEYRSGQEMDSIRSFSCLLLVDACHAINDIRTFSDIYFSF